MRILYGESAKIMPLQALSKNANSASAVHVQCKCGSMLGLLGQFKPDELGRRTIRCDDRTPEQVAEVVRQMGFIIPPDLSRRTKGCGCIGVISGEGQLLRLFEVGQSDYDGFNNALNEVRRRKEARAAAEAAARSQEAAIKAQELAHRQGRI